MLFRSLRISARDRFLRSQYDINYNVVNREICLAGLAQWAAVTFALADLSGESRWRTEGERVVRYLLKKQLSCEDKRLHGGIPGSAPFYGRYMRAAIPNWGVKFLIDALLSGLNASEKGPGVSGHSRDSHSLDRAG